jgi:hypothetical protein
MVAPLLGLLACTDDPSDLLGGADAGAGDDDDPGDDEPDAAPCVPVTEAAGNGLDDDCDALIDESTVCATGADFATLTAAIEALPSGAAIEVCPGSYAERLVLAGKSLHIKGAGGADQTILDAGGGGRAIEIGATEAPGVVLEGLTIQGGVAASGSGGGVRCQDAALALIDVVVTGNVGTPHGGGLYALGCDLAIVGAGFTSNSAEGDDEATGGGAYLEASSGEVRGSAFVGNQAFNGGGLASLGGDVAVRETEVSGNYAIDDGGGVHHYSEAPLEALVVADNQADKLGGGLYLDHTGATLSGSTISGNVGHGDGGGVFVDEGASRLLDNVFSGNQSGDDGGGIRMFKSPGLVQGNLIEQNHADDCGAGVRSSHMVATFVDNLVRDNVAEGQGGGFDLDNDSGVIRGGEITGNRAATAGGGIAAMLWPFDDGLIEDVLIADNVAARGGGIAIEENYKPVTLRRVRFEGNQAALGGAIVVRASKFAMTASILVDNVASEAGGAIAFDEAAPWEPDPSFDPPTRSSLGDVDFCTLHDNSAPAGAGVWTGTPGLSVANSIVSAGGVYVDDGTPAWSYNDTYPASFVGMADPTGTSGNLSVAPGFDADLDLGAGSACVDAADPALEDPDGSRADMGAYGGPDAMP